MATYRQLLLSTGGGVISGSQQDEQNNCATIAIGLGGTGVACLRNLKKQIYSRLQPDDPESPIPQYSHIRFLAVDSDKSSLGADGAFNSLDEATEYFPISSSDINGLLSQTKILANAPECNWLKTEDREKGQRGLSILSATAGAGGVRQIGRLLMLEKSSEFVSRVQRTVTDATRGIQGGAEIIIHIFTGIGGGTGSGTFLDVCYLVQEALERLALKGKALTCGYVFLPDVNLSNTSIEEGSAISRYIKANGFAAMKELDYCMNFQNNHGCWDQEYKGFHIGPIQDTPVKVCHLISAHDIKDTTLRNGFAYAMNVVSDFVMQFLVKPETSPGSKSQALTMTSHIGNYYKAMEEVVKTAGANYQYCLLGASNAIVPMKEIATYLASKLFEEMSRVSQRRPTDQEVNQFAEKNELTYQQIQQALLTGTNYRMPVIDLDYKQFTNMSEEDLALADELILPEIIMKPYRDRLQSNMINQITTNYHAITNEWSLDEIKKDQTSSSKVIATFFALRNLVVDPEYGPFYAADVLNGAQATNLVNHLRGVQKQAENDLHSARGDLTLRMQAVKRARSEFLHGGFLSNKKKNFEEFITATAAYFTIDNYICVLNQMIAMMPVMIRQFINLFDEHFKVYQTVSRNLFDTFHENYQTLSDAGLTETIADPFILPLMKVEDMKESLDSAVRSMKMDVQAQNFHTFLFDRPLIWNTGDEHKISKEVSKYLVDVFHEYTGKTLTDYLEIRFNTSDLAKLTNHVYKDILKPLKDKAEALFWKASGFDISAAQPLGYISIPDTAAVILAASEKLVEGRALSECPSKMKDRVFLLKCLCGVPMHAYNGVNDYGKEYRGDRTVGKHLYELTDRDARNWRTLPDLQPYSTDNNPSQEMEERAYNYDRAIENGIVRKNPSSEDEFQIVVWPSIEQLVDNAETAVSEKNIDKMKRVVFDIEAYRNSREPERIISVTNDGASGHEAKVRKDHVVDSKEMSDIIRAELDKEQKLEEILKNLDAVKSGIGSNMMAKENFFNALYAGVIAVNIPKVSYNEEKFGMTREVILSEPKMEPAGKFVPLYQAFMTYTGMADADRSKIDVQTEARLSDVGAWQAAMQDSCDRLLQTFSDRYLGLMQQQAAKLPEQADEIANLLLEFRQGIDDFKVMYGLA